MTASGPAGTVVAPAADGVPAVDRPTPAGPAPRPRWERPALGALLVATAVAYLWQLDRQGWTNTYYAAAVQAGTQSWKAFLFGSLDAGNFITVDKPPVSLWPMVLSARVFGLSSWSLLGPQVLMGVASVWLLHLTVRRAWGPAAGLLAGLVLALTPAAALMFRYDNPDAALTLLLVAAGYALTRALDAARLRWLLLSAGLVGLAFLTKELQALVPLPAMVGAYLLCAPASLWTRVRHLLLALVVLVVSGGWWIALMELLPASARPYAGGSNTNSVLEILWGYNGLGRITGNESGGSMGGGGLPGGAAPVGGAVGGAVGGPGGGPGGAGGFGGSAGVLRMLNEQFGPMVGWLLPAALVGLVVALVVALRARRRTDARLASVVLWGGWTLVTAAVFSFGSGIIHPYYAVALAPGVAALATMALPALWRSRRDVVARIALAAWTAVAAATGLVLLARTPSWLPVLRWTIAVLALVAVVGLLAAPLLRRLTAVTAVTAAAAVTALVAGLLAPAAWSLATLGQVHSGGDPSTGPAVASARGFGAGPGGGFGGGPSGGFGGAPSGAAGGQPGGAAGGSESAVVDLLEAVDPSYTWAAATSSSMSQGGLQLASGRAVMALGGFGGGDPAISLDGFKALVAAQQVRYFVGGGSGGPGGGFGGGFGGGPGGGGTASQIAQWVSENFTATTVGGSTVYDLSAPTSAAAA